jgi:hypothetical protein
MAERVGPRRLLFQLTRALAAGLAGAVLAAPWLDAAGAAPGDWARVVALFGHDPVVRRTALAGALGLLVTAYVFFRPPSDVAGA